jgi:hypothetical protein
MQGEKAHAVKGDVDTLRCYSALPRDLRLHFASISGRTAPTARHGSDSTTKASFLAPIYTLPPYHHTDKPQTDTTQPS